MEKNCKDCGVSIFVYDTITNRCAKCMRKRNNGKKVKQRKPIPTVGKKTKKWLAHRKRWLKNHRPNHRGNYICYICLHEIPEKEITLDHVIPRSKRGDLIFDDSNIRPACYTCNQNKGSKDY